MKRNAFFAKKADKRGEIFIYQEIGEGWFGGISANSFAEALKEVGDVTELHLYINSPGGNVFDGVAIYNQLKRHAARKIVHIDALAASIASVIAMAGDEIRMASNAQIMIHQAWGLCIGTADEMRKNAEVMDGIDTTIIDTYVARTKGDEKQIRQWVRDETWMLAKEAKERGFADVIENEEADPKDMAFPLLAKFKNTPSALREESRAPALAIARMQARTNEIPRRTPAKT